MKGRIVSHFSLILVLAICMEMSKAAEKTNAQKRQNSNEQIVKIWNTLLEKFVDPKTGRVDYLGLDTVGKAELKRMLELYGTIDTASMSDDAKKAHYINFYNAGMMYNILRYAEENKIKVDSKKFLEIEVNDIDVPGGNIWDGSYTFKFAGQKVNLDNIEHGLIRGDEDKLDTKLRKYQVKKLDPRIHAAVNCAAISCPRVREKAYEQSTVDRILDENMKEWLASTQQFKKVSGDKLRANSIVFWYYGDFDDYAQTVLKLDGAGSYLSRFVIDSRQNAKWLRSHLQENFNDRSRFTLKFSSSFDFHYNWQINDQRN